jgi:hypothetical protein
MPPKKRKRTSQGASDAIGKLRDEPGGDTERNMDTSPSVLSSTTLHKEWEHRRNAADLTHDQPNLT